MSDPPAAVTIPAGRGPFGACCCGGVAGRLVRDVGDQSEMAVADACGGYGGLRLRQIQDDYVGAMRRHQAGRGKTQAVDASCAGNDGDFIL